MVIDFSDLDELVKPLIEMVDHTDLNISLRGRGVTRTTAEAICGWFADEIYRAIHQSSIRYGVILSRVRLWETDKGYAEWTP